MIKRRFIGQSDIYALEENIQSLNTHTSKGQRKPESSLSLGSTQMYDMMSPNVLNADLNQDWGNI